MRKTKFRKIVVTAFALCMVVIMMCMSACKKDPETPPKGEDDVAIVTSITLNTANCKTTFKYKEAFSAAGLVVTAHMSDGTTETIPLAMCNVSTPDMTTAGVKTVTVTYKNNIRATYQITVGERELPPISSTPLAEINEDRVYRIEAEDIDLDISGVEAVTDSDLIVEANAEEEVSNDKYLANYGVDGNYFGFTFTADKEYKNVTLVFRVANPTTRELGIGANMNVYLNYKSTINTGKLDIADVTTLPAAKITKAEDEDGEDVLEMEWVTRILRNVTIPAGVNTLTFDVLGENVVCIDYIELYAGVAYGTNSVTELTGVGMFITDVEDFDLEKIVVRADVKNAHGLADGQAFTETPSVNLANTHGGLAVGAMAKGSEITTALRLAENATIHILYTIASVEGYKVKDNYEFYIDGELLEDVEDYYIKAGDPWKQGSQYWEWRDTSLGYLDLEAGDHIFTVKVTGKDCNCDCFKFDVLSYGEYTEHPEYVGKININSLDTYVMEAENIDMFYEAGHSYIVSGGGVTNGYYKINSNADCSNGRYIDTFEAGSKLVFTIYSLEDTTVDIAMRAVHPSSDTSASIADSLKLYLDETEIPVSQNAIDLHSSDWRTVTLAEDVEIEGGKLYTFTMEIINPFWLDNITIGVSEYDSEVATVESVTLDASSAITEYEINEQLNTDGIVVTATMSNGFVKTLKVSGCEVGSVDMATAGEKTVTVSYGGKSDSYTIVVHGEVVGISVNAEGAKLIYKVNDEFTAEGVIVTADTGNGTYKTIDITECQVSSPDMSTAGDKTITVTYLGQSDVYTIKVIQVESIELDTDGAPKAFKVNGTFSANGVIVTATLSDQTTVIINIDDCQVTPPDLSSPGEQIEVVVSYDGKTASYYVTVLDKEVVINADGSFDMIASNLKKDGVVTRDDFVPSIGQGNYGVGGGGIYGFKAGTVFTVDLYADADCIVTIAISLHSDQTATFGQNFEFKMDGVVLTQLNPDASMLPNSAFHSTIVATVQLTKGDHTFSMEVLKQHFDLEKITFTATSFGEELPEVPDVEAGEVALQQQAILNEEHD